MVDRAVPVRESMANPLRHCDPNLAAAFDAHPESNVDTLKLPVYSVVEEYGNMII